MTKLQRKRYQSIISHHVAKSISLDNWEARNEAKGLDHTGTRLPKFKYDDFTRTREQRLEEYRIFHLSIYTECLGIKYRSVKSLLKG